MPLTPEEKAFLVAIESNKVEDVQNALKNEVNVNCTLPINDSNRPYATPLHIAVRNVNPQIVALLLKSKAKTHLADKEFKTPIQYVEEILKSEQKPSLSNPSILMFIDLLYHRTPFTEGELVEHMTFCRERYIGDEKDAQSSAKDAALLDFVVSRLTGTKINTLRNQEKCARYSALLKSIIGKLHHEKDGKIISTDLESWRQDEFLAFRIRILWEICLRMELGLLKPLNEFNCEHLRNLYIEIIIDLESLHVSLAMIAIRDVLSQDNFANHEEIANALTEALAKNIADRLKHLPDNREYSLPAGWVAHSLYINIARQKEYLLLRVDNLGPGCKENHLVNNTHQIKDYYFYPKLLGKLHYDHLDSLIRYLAYWIRVKINRGDKNNLKKQSNLKTQITRAQGQEQEIVRLKKEVEELEKQRLEPLQKEALMAIYLPPLLLLERSDLKESTYPAEIIQTTGRCVVASHNVGLHIRLGNDKLYKWVLEQELQVLAQLENRLPQHDFTDLWLQENQPRCLPQRLDKPLKKLYQERSVIRFLFDDRELPIIKSYVNLAIIEEKEQKQQEEKLRKAKNHTEQDRIAILGTLEDIHSAKKPINIEDVFQSDNAHKQRILVLGRAGIGKTTFCQHVLQQWMTGGLWRSFKFDYIFHIPLRNLNTNRYPPKKNYTLIDLIRQECFSDSDQPLWTPQLAGDVEHLLKSKTHKILWLLDGRDELPQPLPPQLQAAWETLLNSSYYIITSRPHVIPTLPNGQSFTARLEITGFTDDNIRAYVKQFFATSVLDSKVEITSPNDEKKQEIAHMPLSDDLLTFLHLNPNIWGIAHIPINLELICSLWKDQAARLQEAKESLTVTGLYQQIVLWLLRRFLKNQGMKDELLQNEERIFDRCKQLLEILEHTAFQLMQNNQLILPGSELNKIVGNKLSRRDDLFSMHILKPLVLDEKQTNNDCYFVHLTFQEFLAACYLARILEDDKHRDFAKIKEFIFLHKYERRWELVFKFTAGLVASSSVPTANTVFWEMLQSPPLELIGIQHLCLLMNCLQEADCEKVLAPYAKMLAYLQHNLPRMLLCTRNYISDASHKLRQVIEASGSVIAHPHLCKPLLRELVVNETNIVEGLIERNALKSKRDIIKVLKELMFCDKEENIRTSSAFALKNVPEIRKELFKRANNQKNIKERLLALKLIGVQESKDDEVLDFLITLIQKDKQVDARKQAMNALKSIGNYAPKVMRVLEYASQKEQDKEVKEVATRVHQFLLNSNNEDYINACGEHYIDYDDDNDKPTLSWEELTPAEQRLVNSHMDRCDALLFGGLLEEKNTETKVANNYRSLEIKGRSIKVTEREYIDYQLESELNEKYVGDERLEKLSSKELIFLLEHNFYMIKTPVDKLMNAYKKNGNSILGKIIANRVFDKIITVTIRNSTIYIYDDQRHEFNFVSERENIILTNFLKMLKEQVKGCYLSTIFFDEFLTRQEQQRAKSPIHPQYQLAQKKPLPALSTIKKVGPNPNTIKPKTASSSSTNSGVQEPPNKRLKSINTAYSVARAKDVLDANASSSHAQTTKTRQQNNPSATTSSVGTDSKAAISTTFPAKNKRKKSTDAENDRRQDLGEQLKSQSTYNSQLGNNMLWSLQSVEQQTKLHEHKIDKKEQHNEQFYYPEQSSESKIQQVQRELLCRIL